MQCSAQEIEEKRRQAMLKLAARQQKQANNTTSYLQSNNQTYNQPRGNFFQENGNKSSFSPNKKTWGSRQTTPYSRPSASTSTFDNINVITATCNLISEERFTVEMSRFFDPAIQIFKTMPTRSYDTKTRAWDFNISDYEVIQRKLALFKPQLVVGVIPQYVLRCVRAPKPNYTLIDLSPIEEELRCALMPFQEEGVQFGIDKNGRCLIGDDMGLGKTFQALAIASYYKNDWPLLIATTASMKNTWEETILKYLPSVPVMHIQYMVSKKDYIGDSKVLIVSHDIMARCSEKLLERNFGVIIIDESHTFKNFKAKCTKTAMDLTKKAKRVVLLSGTPALSRPSELYSQLSFLDEHFFGNFINYSKRYCDGKTTNFGWDASGQSNLQELGILLNHKFMIRRTKEDVLKSLPDKEQQLIALNVNLEKLSEEDREALSTLAKKYACVKKGNEKHALLLTFFSETAKIKIPAVCSYILQVIDECKKFLIFAHHQVMINAICEVLTKKKVKFIRIDGKTASSSRKSLVDTFQYDDSYICAVLSTTAANAGITLTAAQLVLFAELHWNPSILSQAEARAHRIGQQGKVTVRYLIAAGTADDSIWPMLQSKQKILEEVGLSKESLKDIEPIIQEAAKENHANCLNSSITSSNTLDISTYFSPHKTNATTSSQNEFVPNFNKVANLLNTTPQKNASTIPAAELSILNSDIADCLDDDDFDSFTNAVHLPSKTNSKNNSSLTSGLTDWFSDGFTQTCISNMQIKKTEVQSGDMSEFFNDDLDDVLGNIEM